MLDPKYLRDELDTVAEKLRIRGYTVDVASLQSLETKRKVLQTKLQDLQSARNHASKKIGIAKSNGGTAGALLAEMKQLSHELDNCEQQFRQIKHELDTHYHSIPNIPHHSVPSGVSDQDNIEIRKWGDIKAFKFACKDHVDIGENLGQLDFKVATKLTGSRFVVMYAGIARLHRALIQFMLDTHIAEHGYTEVNVPYLVNADSMFGTGQLPKFADDFFNAEADAAFSLIPTAEVPVTNLVRDQIIDAKQLPLKYVCHSPCFRKEAGSYGKDTRGMIRMHQFEKVELVQIVEPAASEHAHEALTEHAEVILQKLQLPYRVVVLCGGDLGFSASKTYDLEVWLPGQSKYREISSCSNFTDFQARRMHARWRNPAQKSPELVHTLNGSALAVGRTLIAILENYQDQSGRVAIPEVLVPYMGGIEWLE